MPGMVQGLVNQDLVKSSLTLAFRKYPSIKEFLEMI